MDVLDEVSATPGAPSGGPRPATSREELVFVAFLVWTLIGLCLDGWAHRHRPELESFFTPWHGVFYTGYLGAVGWLGVMVVRRRADEPTLRAAIPEGYGLAVAGMGLFALGGVGDGIWHTAFGVETSLDALLSPTHLVLLVGMLAAGTAPIRAAWRGVSEAAGAEDYRTFLPVTVSLAAATTGVAFFHLYANGFNNWPLQVEYVPQQEEVEAALGVLSILASTLILLFPVMLLLRRWRPPVGTFTTLFTIVGTFLAGLDAFEFWWQILAPAIGGMVTDAVVATGRLATVDRQAEARRRAWTCGWLVPLVMWPVSILATDWAWGVRWPPELWAGSIVMAALAGWALAITTHPPPRPSTAAG